MPQVFDPANSQLKSVTQVGALLEIAIAVNVAESAYNAANPTRTKSLLTTTMSGDEKTAQINAVFPISQAVDASGRPFFSVSDYLGAGYSAFDGNAAIVSTTVMAAFLEQCHKVQAFELAFPETDRPNAVSIEYSSDGQQVTIACNLPIQEAINADGSIKYTAVDYL